jgi:hypothetical protein
LKFSNKTSFRQLGFSLPFRVTSLPLSIPTECSVLYLAVKDERNKTIYGFMTWRAEWELHCKL